MKILIAEDDFTSRLLLTAVLTKFGYEVVVTENGAESWEELQKPNAPSVVILDWMMPAMDGLEVVSRVRAMQLPHQPYIIMLTAKGDKSSIVDGLDAGADDYVTKPFDPEELRARVNVGCRMIKTQDALIESQEILSHQATHDSLTGLLNRRAILSRLREEIARANRYGSSLAVGMCDIDHFIQFNDMYGHQTGDDVLCELAQIMRKSIREYDSAGRLGGEEFLVITPMKEGAHCLPIFGRMCIQIAESAIPTRSGVLSVKISIGVACSLLDKSADDILKAADAALYRAKNEGRNRVVHDMRCIYGSGNQCVS